MLSVSIRVIMCEQCIKQWVHISQSLKYMYDISVLKMYIYRLESYLFFFVVSLRD